MAGIKIINVLKDDTFPEILELFRQATATEVIFVLPKKSKVFRTEDHFAAFAGEAASAGKSVSILCSTAEVNTLARKYKFSVMSASREKATLASAPIGSDDPLHDPNEDAYQDDVPMTSDETMGTTGQDDEGEEEEIGHGMHVEDKDGPVDDNADDKADEPAVKDLEIEDDTELVAAPAVAPMATLAATRSPLGSSAAADLDYIDTMWRQKAAQSVAPEKPVTSVRRWKVASPTAMSKKVAVGILGVSLVLLGAVIYITTGSATIAIAPITKPVDARIQTQVSDVFSSVDANFGKVPGQLFQISKTGTAEVPATGQRDVASKARGKVTVSNSFSSTPQTLIATTRFESKDGMIFRTLQSVTVPGSTVSNGQTVAGTVTVDVIADKPGTQYNIETGDFTIPAFKERGDTDRYGKVTAKSTQKFAGGASGPSKVVTQADYDAAKDAAIKDARDQITTAFAAQSSGLTILKGIEPSLGEVESSARVDDAGDSVKVTVQATLKTVAFRQDDLFKLISETVSKNERLDVFPDKLTLAYEDAIYKEDVHTLSFIVSAAGTGYLPLDTKAIISDILGKNGEGFRTYFKDKEGVESATAAFSPFWVRSIPKDAKRVNLTVDYAQPTATPAAQ